ncbi:MAG: DUF4349 domain-containing protein [Betaproteobacteria bacterium]|nr:DUF4349 domain-containing protein [Betaproteobacteria bacterium]
MSPQRFACLLLLGGGFVSAAMAVAPQVEVGASLTIQVADRDQTAAQAIAKAEALGGYFSSIANDAVTLKLPAAKSREMIDFVKAHWKPVEESYRARDVVSALDQSRARLKAKEELYARFQKLLAAAEAGDILEVEAAASKLIGEIELLKGRLRAMQHRIDFATVVVNFRLMQRERPRDDGNSPFAWLNGLGLDALLRGFER